MNTTEFIKLLKSVENGASKRPREIKFYIEDDYISNYSIDIVCTGDGIAGAELVLKISKYKEVKNEV